MTENRFTPFDRVEYMERLERISTDMRGESFDGMIDRIAKAFHAQPCPAWESSSCNPDMHDWDFAMEEDKQWMRDTVRFILTEAGLG